MEILPRENSPLDHGYYRTISPAYRQYLMDGGLTIHQIGPDRFGWIKNVFGLFQVAKFERMDYEPDIEKLRKDGFKHGMVIWIPYTKMQKPKGWRNLLLNSHFTTTGFTVLEDENYYKKWKERARRARKKFLADPEMRIELFNTKDFQEIYKKSGMSKHKSSFMRYHEKISSMDKKGDITNIVCFRGDVPLAGLAVIDYNGNSSAHLVAFHTKEGKKTQAGTGVIDYWFQMSLKKGIKYINFDHLKDKYMTSDQQGYTTFKENFMDYKVIYEQAYFKIL